MEEIGLNMSKDKLPNTKIYKFLNTNIQPGDTGIFVIRPKIELYLKSAYQINKIVIEETCREYFNVLYIRCNLTSQLKGNITAKRFHELQNLSDILYKDKLDILNPGLEFRIDVQNISKQIKEFSGYIEGEYI